MNLKVLGIIGIILVVFSGGLYAFIRLPKTVEVMSDPANLAWLQNTLIAHRGLHDDNKNVPENSLPAFEDAIEKGYIIELDVAMTKDEKLVVYHDKKLLRGLGVDRYLHELTYEELSQYKLFGTTEKIPLFREVLALVAGQVPLLIEIKNEGKVGEMERLICEELKGYPGKYAIQSFNPFTIQWFRQHAPEVVRGQLAGSFEVSDYDVEYAGTTRLPWYKKVLLKNMLFNFLSRPHFIAYEINNISAGRLERLKKLGVPLLGWTVKTRAEYEENRSKFNNLIVDAVLRQL